MTWPPPPASSTPRPATPSRSRKTPWPPRASPSNPTAARNCQPTRKSRRPRAATPRPLTPNLFPGLTENRIAILKAAGITTVGGLQQVGAPKSGIRNEWVPANTDNRITADVATTLGARSPQMAAHHRQHQAE